MPPAQRAPRNTPAVVDPAAESDPAVQADVAAHPDSVVSPETVVGAPPVAKTEPPAPVYVAPAGEGGKPLPESQLTPEQLEIRRLQDALAIQDAQRLETREDVFDTAVAEDVEDSIIVHVLVDGFTACGRVWYRGQEIEFVKGSTAHEQTKDRDGKSWLDMVGPKGEMDQARRWGEIKFRSGPWPGDSFEDTEALVAERKRNRAAPVMGTR